MAKIYVTRSSLGMVWDVEIMSSAESWSTTVVCVNSIVAILVNVGSERAEIVFVAKREDKTVRT